MRIGHALPPLTGIRDNERTALIIADFGAYAKGLATGVVNLTNNPALEAGSQGDEPSPDEAGFPLRLMPTGGITSRSVSRVFL